jgi:hypothetical protein
VLEGVNVIVGLAVVAGDLEVAAGEAWHMPLLAWLHALLFCGPSAGHFKYNGPARRAHKMKRTVIRRYHDSLCRLSWPYWLRARRHMDFVHSETRCPV